MKKYIALFFSMSILILILIFIKKNNNLDDQYKLKGTFICEELPFATMVFDADYNYIFYNYTYNSQSEMEKHIDTGTFFSKTKSIYVINSKHFNNKEIIYVKDNIEITINDIQYSFKKISDIPTMLLWSLFKNKNKL